MKSTGLFGKNSGRVGGVVYSNYRGQQVVRSYQPQVHNPNTKGQVEQRAKFKLVSQLGAAFGKELSLSFFPLDRKMTPRNAWVKKMLSKTVYSSGVASLPIEDIVLTNAMGGIIQAETANNRLDVYIPKSEWDISLVKLRAVMIAYNNGGEINMLRVMTILPSESQQLGDYITFSQPIEVIPSGYANVRMIVYAYEPKIGSNVSYEDYSVLGEDATLGDVVKLVGLSNLRFSESFNIQVLQSV